jgi:hypothetical protein
VGEFPHAIKDFRMAPRAVLFVFPLAVYHVYVIASRLPGGLAILME